MSFLNVSQKTLQQNQNFTRLALKRLAFSHAALHALSCGKIACFENVNFTTILCEFLHKCARLHIYEDEYPTGSEEGREVKKNPESCDTIKICLLELSGMTLRKFTQKQLWGGKKGEAEVIRNCYRNSLKIAKDLNCKNISIPLLAAENYGFPKETALNIDLDEISRFLFEKKQILCRFVFC